MNNIILIGSDEGSYVANNGLRTITLSGLSFTPTAEQLAYVYNKTQDKLYYCPAEGIAKATFAAGVITIDGSFPVLVNTDTIHIQMWRPATGMTASMSCYDKYSNASGDFTATITNATKTITITGLNYTIEDIHVMGGSIKKKAVTTNDISVLPLTNISVSGGVITLGDAADFVTGDTVLVEIVGPDKTRDKTIDAEKIANLNPDYGHYTSVEQVVAESAIKGTQGTGTAGGSTTLLVGTGFTVASGGQAVGYRAYQTTDTQSALVTSVDSATNITTPALSGGATWASKAYSLPLVNRYEIPMEGYNFLTLHYYMLNGAGLNTYLKIYGTLNAAATADADTSWVDMSAEILGNAAGINVGASASAEDVIILDTPRTMLKYMLKLVVEYSVGGGTPVNTYNVYIKKSS